MAGTAEGHHIGEEGGAGSSDGVFEPSMDKFPVHIISHILEKLDLGSVCTAACVSPTFSSAAAQLLPSISSLDLSGYYLDKETLKQVVRRVQGAKSLTIDCLQLKNDTSIFHILGEHIEDLSLLKCSSLSYHILSAIRERSLLIEFAGCEDPQLFKNKLTEMLQKLTLLEDRINRIGFTGTDPRYRIKLPKSDLTGTGFTENFQMFRPVP
uniref:F-box family protein n=1 Tax=Solanum tuberosum TaxID=4113 RepID=M1C0Q8_SOLTU